MHEEATMATYLQHGQSGKKGNLSSGKSEKKGFFGKSGKKGNLSSGKSEKNQFF